MKKVLIFIIICMSSIGLVFLGGCKNNTETSNSDSLLSIAINQMRSLSNYTITTTVESQTMGIRSEKKEEVFVSERGVTVKTTYKKPNEIGAEEAYTTTTEESTYNTDDFIGIVFNVEGLKYNVNGDIIEVRLSSKADVKSVFDLDDVEAADIKIKINNDCFEYLTYSYLTNSHNTVTVTVKPQ